MQPAPMATARASWERLRRLVPLLAEMMRQGGEADDLLQLVVYVTMTDSRRRYCVRYREEENCEPKRDA